MELKNYQKAVMSDLSSFLDAVDRENDIIKGWRSYWSQKDVPVGPEGVPFYQNKIPGTPHVCMKVPTGGGKTFMACSAVKRIFAHLPADKPKVVVWLVPSDSILTQTIRTLTDVTHPYRQRLDMDFAGRVGILHLEGLSLAERDGQPDRPPFLPVPESLERRAARAAKSDSLFHLIWKGAYPQMHGAGDDKWASFYGAYVQTSIERDVRDMGAVGSELAFLAFMKALAARTGQLLNCSDIAREVGKSAPTIRAWVSRLRTSGLIVLLPSYPHAAGSRVIKTPRIYFMDTGLACFLTGWTSPQTLECGAMSGAMLETFVVSESLKSWWHNGRQPNMFSYRDKDRREISILLEENGVLHPVAITRKTNPARGDIRAFGVIEKVLRQKRGHGAVLCMTQTHVPVRADVDAVPIHCI